MTWTGRTLPSLQVFNILRINLSAGLTSDNNWDIYWKTKLMFPLAEVPSWYEEAAIFGCG
jgi:hypothetical protein